MIDYFEDVFWFTEEILTKSLNKKPENIYNLFPNLTTIRQLKELYFLGNQEEYYEFIKQILNQYENITK